ncbi:hypothetical protein M426DRAFT_144501 [Hypoxylon sp. CI-4A]|nr:hypothetical protein M426DRAFT_144501 [Hypoxylon sp. CI-4A]
MVPGSGIYVLTPSYLYAAKFSMSRTMDLQTICGGSSMRGWRLHTIGDQAGGRYFMRAAGWTDELSLPLIHILDFYKQVLSDPSFARDFIADPELSYLDEDICDCYAGVSSVETYQALLSYQCPQHLSTSLDSRVQSANRAIYQTGHLEVVKLILEPDWSNNSEAIFSNTTSGIIPAIARRLCFSAAHELASYRGIHPASSDSRSWFTFAVKAASEAVDLHTIYRNYDYGYWSEKTALFHVASIALPGLCAGIFPSFHSFNYFHRIVVVWLKVLAAADVDLDAYGRREHQILIENDSLRYFDIYPSWRDEMPFTTYCLIDFTFGHKPEDWVFYWQQPTDEFAGDFWNLVEDRPLPIPGSWVDS